MRTAGLALLALGAFATLGCGGGGTLDLGRDASSDTPPAGDASRDASGDVGRPGDSGRTNDASSGLPDASGDGASDAGHDADAGHPGPTCTLGDGGASACYAMTCTAKHQNLQVNRDRLVADLARRKCTDSCTLWAALNQAERYIFLMDTAYLASSESLLYPPPSTSEETALDHAAALYSINGPDAGQGVLLNGMGGNDYNRIYLGFDPFATCVMRDFALANPSHSAGYNLWVKSDDLAGPHAPFTQREMIAWFKAFYDLQTQGPQFHHWHQDSDFDASGLDARLGVCGVTDPTITELTIAFDSVHDSNPLGNYGSDGDSNGGYGWQIVDQFLGAGFANWSYIPTSCPITDPVNTDPTGGGTFAGMGPSQSGGACVPAPLGSCP